MFKALVTSIADLSDAQLWSTPIEGRNSIGSILLHVLENIDRHACYFQVGTWTLDRGQHERLNWSAQEVRGGPGVWEIQEQIQTLEKGVWQTLEGITDRDLYSPRYGAQTYWWEQHKRLSIDAYHRVVWHANAHVRQIWCLRGMLGAVDDEHFPRQFWH
jgi:hypothetical protein